MADQATPTVSCDQLAVPSCLESPRSKLLYLTLAVTGEARTSELRSALDMSPLSLYPLVRDLQAAGLVEQSDDGVLRIAEAPTSRIGSA